MLCIIIVNLVGCSKNNDYKRFTLLSPDHTNVDFINKIKNTSKLNIQNYGYFYDGGGVAVGDINNDGLPDIYFIGNEKTNRLYLNKGNFVFKDITKSAGVGGDTTGWSTGATMADVNGDGYLDIYVSRVNYRNKTGANQLFVNNGNNTFTESASKYGLDFRGYSTQAAFFDYDKDGDLDMYLLNHSFHSQKTTGQKAGRLRALKDSLAGDRLFRNNGNHFTDVTKQAGIYSSAIGFGLGVAISDINRDGWPDIYIGNDYQEGDYLYFNNGDGTFSENLDNSIKHTSRSSMGNDIADINNDGKIEILSVDMLPEEDTAYKQSSGSATYRASELRIKTGYNPQYMHNTLQLNRGDISPGIPVFSEIGFAAGIGATDWSWAPLIMDMDNDGLKDIFITNGIFGRPTDLDYNHLLQSQHISLNHDDKQGALKLIKDMPPVKISNYVFKNNGDLTFKNRGPKWGLAQPSYSSGAAYADFNKDGALDIVVNNVNMPAFIYQNNSDTDSTSHFLNIKLIGKGKNTSGIGTKVLLYINSHIHYQEQMPTRGFQSSVDPILHFGLASTTLVDSLIVVWPDDSYQRIEDVNANQIVPLKQINAHSKYNYDLLHRSSKNAFLKDITGKISIKYTHHEDDFSSFAQEPLMSFDLSTQGPAIACGDVNNDGIDDFFVGGAQGQPGVIFIQNKDGSFSALNKKVLEIDRASEDVSAVFFDANNDSLLDLYVVSGGDEFYVGDKNLKDRLYINEGGGRFRKAKENLPDLYGNGSVVAAADFNGDDYTDLFVGSTAQSWTYGVIPKSYLLENDGTGKFTDVTESVAPELREAGMVTDAKWIKTANSEYPKLLLAGQWMPVSLFDNNGQKLYSITGQAGLNKRKGLWTKLLVNDFNGDGKFDIIAGNFGKGSSLKASVTNPLRLYTFNKNGQIVSVIARYRKGHYYPFESLNELLSSFSFISSRVSSYADYATKSMSEIFDKKMISDAQIKEINILASVYFESQEDQTFKIKKLPMQAQFSPVMALYSDDFNKDGNEDILLAGNMYSVKPSIGGRQDAGYGTLLQGDGKGNFNPVDLQASGFYVDGKARGIISLRTASGDTLLVVAKNDQPVQIFGE